MKKTAYVVLALVTVLLTLGADIVQAQATTPVSQWGFIGATGGTSRIGGWKFTPGTAGNATISGTAAPTTWSAVRGAFSTITPGTGSSQALVVTGKMEFTGAGFEAWSSLRFGVFYTDSAGTLISTPVDSTRWSGTENNSYGYLFTPYSGTNDPVAWLGAGKNGSHGGVVNRPWISTNGANDYVLGEFRQKPARAVATAGVYSFAISVQLKTDTTSEVRFYLIKDGTPVAYYFGGTSLDNNKPITTTRFNSVCFAVQSGTANADIRGLKLIDVKVGQGAPITVPEPPWQAYYVDQWGFFARGPAPTWKFVPGAVIGNAGLVGTAAPNGPWTVVRGGFVEPVTATTSKAIIVTGKMEFIGAGPSTWGAIRYGLFRHDSAGTVRFANTDSARWQRQVGADWVTGKESDAYGYMFQPRSGTNEHAGWAVGGAGAYGVVRGGAWISTFGNAHISLGMINQKPINVVAGAGKYNFAISVQPKADGSGNEVRFYFIKEDNSYWIAGTATDTTKITAAFNGVCFGLNGGNGAETGNLRGLNLLDVQVDLGNPITIPEAPWQAFYVDQWGILARGPAPNWKFVPGAVIGNAGVAGTAAISGTWTAIRGGFPEAVTPTTTKAIIVKGKMEFVGAGPEVWSALRYGLFRHDSAGTLRFANTDSAKWQRQVGADWVTGKEGDAYGYMITPRSGTNTHASWAVGGNGTAGVIRGGTWLSTFGASHASLGMINQKPINVVAGAGKYNFAISVHPKADGSGNELRFYFIREDNKYWIGGTVVDTFKIASSFNGVCFGLIDNSHADLRTFNVLDVQVDLGTPITIPEAPWEAFYVDQWGFIGGRMGGWKFTPGDVIGNATISGTAPNTSWSAIRGGFPEPVTPTTSKALVVTGKMEFVGGGFQALSSFRFGLYHSDSAGTVLSTPVDSTRWSGKEGNHFGYLFVPQSGTNTLATWAGIAKQGSWGAIVNGTWWSTDAANSYILGSNRHTPTAAVAGAGTYDFAISVLPKTDGSQDVRFKVTRVGGGYALEGKAINKTTPLPTTKFNSVAFALNTNATTTGMKLLDVKIDLGDTLNITTNVEVASEGVVPADFALLQNYPNPFNPSTTIRYDIAKQAHVTIRVYDMLGRVVAQLVDADQMANRYIIQWNPTGLTSGTYLYRIDARNQDGSGTFTSVKKLLYMK